MNIVQFFVVICTALSVCIFYLKICCICPESFLCKQKKIEYSSPEIVSALENKELLNHFKVFSKRATSAHMDGRIIADIPLYTGQFSRMQFIPENAFEISNKKYLKSLP